MLVFRLADQVRTIIKKGWFSDLEILEIHQKTLKQDNTIPNTSSGANQKQHIRNELPTFENEYATVPSNPTERLSHKQQKNLENLKRIMNSEKTNLPSLRNMESRTLKTETNKINQTLPYISTNNITVLDELIYAGAKLVYEKTEIPLKGTKKQAKPGWEIRLETQIKNQRKQVKMVKQKELGIYGNRTQKATREKITVQLEEINQKALAKEERLKRYQQRVKQYRQNRTFLQLYGFQYSYLIRIIYLRLYGFKYSNLIQIICLQLYGFKYSYLIQIICHQLHGFKSSYLTNIICLPLYGFKYSSLIQIICLQLYGFKYSYLILIIRTQLYGFIYSYLKKIICMQLYRFKYSYLTQNFFKKIYFIHRWNNENYFGLEMSVRRGGRVMFAVKLGVYLLFLKR